MMVAKSSQGGDTVVDFPNGKSRMNYPKLDKTKERKMEISSTTLLINQAVLLIFKQKLKVSLRKTRPFCVKQLHLSEAIFDFTKKKTSSNFIPKLLFS